MFDEDWPQSIKPYPKRPPVNSVGIVMPVRDGLKFFKLSFHSIINFTDYHYMMALVDNVSSEFSNKVLRGFGANHNVNLFEYMEVNRSASINLAMRQMFTCPGINYGCVVAQDAVFEPNWLSRLMKTILSDRQLGVVAPATNIGTTLQTDRATIGRVVKANSVGGGCILFGKQAFLCVNGFDESFHGGYEDLDFCERVKQKGFTIAIDGRVYIHRFFVTDEHQLSSEYERMESKRRYEERYPLEQARAGIRHEPKLAVYEEKKDERFTRA